ncbi:MAG: HipA domain-containing protein, partial [Candidatus Methanomethylophilaceae archaeon]|nr:HipA domain-containing protein [Candidatus Methanomethylophilaceae archaeon]
MDYSHFPKADTFYAGSEKKIGIRINNEEWILKFQYRDSTKIRFNHVSEYIGSHIFGLLGFDVQHTELGHYKGEQVVACRNFIPEGYAFVPFNDVGESSLDTESEHHSYTYEEIVHLIDINKKLTDVEGTRERFWDIFVVDALLGNFDRHGGNWGFIKTDNQYRLSPVFDNGSCLFPQMNSDEEMSGIIESPEMTDDRVYRFPTSQIKMGGKKSSYHEVIGSLRFPECNEALRRIVPRVDLDRIS